MTMARVSFESFRWNRPPDPCYPSLGIHRTNFTTMNKSILIVDAEEHTREAISDVAKSLSLKPLVASSLEEAQELVRQDPPDLAICDIRLSDGLGANLIRFLRNLDTRCEVIVMTACSGYEIVVGAIREGAADFLEKPFTVEQLSASLSRVEARNTQMRVVPKLGLPARVLIVDDDAVTLKFVAKVLGDAGMVTHPVSDLTQARSILAEHPIDVAVVDVFLKKESGLDLVREVQTTHTHSSRVSWSPSRRILRWPSRPSDAGLLTWSSSA